MVFHPFSKAVAGVGRQTVNGKQQSCVTVYDSCILHGNDIVVKMLSIEF